MQNDLTELRTVLCYTGLFREAILKEVIEVLSTCMRRDVIMQSSEKEDTKTWRPVVHKRLPGSRSRRNAFGLKYRKLQSWELTPI